jgi:phage protein D
MTPFAQAAMPSPQFVPDYAITINGTQIPTSLQSSIASVVFESGINAADRVEVAVANPGLQWLQSHINGLGFLPFPTNVRIGPIQTSNFNGTGLFDMANKLSLSIGYADQMLADVFEGEITGIEVSLPSDGMPMLTIVAHNYLNRLAQGSYGRGFGPLPDALIAAILSAENLLLPLIDPAIAAGSTAIAVVNFIFNGSGRKQKAQTDLQLLQEIARTYDADFWVEGSTLYLSRFIKEYTPSVNLTWGESLMEFSPKISTVGAVFGVGVKFTLREIPLSFMVTASWNLDTQSLAINVVPGASAAYLKSLIGPIVSIINRPISSPPDIINSALFITRKLRDTLNNRLTARATAVGDPSLLANAVVQFNGIGPDFSGNYRITNAHHVIDANGYRTNVKVRKEILP